MRHLMLSLDIASGSPYGCVCVCMFVCVCVCMYVYMYVFDTMSAYHRVYVCVYVCVHVCVYSVSEDYLWIAAGTAITKETYSKETY